MESATGTFTVEDAFNITNLGLVLVGQLVRGEVTAGNWLVFEGGPRWRVRAVNPLQHRTRPEIVGLLVEAPPTLRPELQEAGIIGATALISMQ